MEEKGTVKKSNAPMLIMLAAVLLIVAGVVLIVTGNNKSFWEKEEPKEGNKEENKQNPNHNINEIPSKKIKPGIVTEEELVQLITETKKRDFPGETWEVGEVKLLAHDEEDEKVLISYTEVHEDLTIVTKQTIVTILNEEKMVELPGWAEGERDLTVYNFIDYTHEDSPVTPDSHGTINDHFIIDEQEFYIFSGEDRARFMEE